MTSIKHPLISLEMNDETARYVGLLERKLLMLTLDNLKCRTVLELLTDEAWDDQAFPDDEGELKRVATDALVRRLGVPASEAADIVRERWGRYNPPAASAGTAEKYIVGPTTAKRPAHVSTSEQTVGYDIEKHREGLARAAANRAAATVPESSQS